MNIKKGFSLIEIIIFCFIAITLFTLFAGLVFNSRDFARTMGCVNNMKNLAQAIENFQADFKMTPVSIGDLYPQYVTNKEILKCPADRTADSNSYDKYYIGRFIASARADNVFLVCPRHNRRNKTVAAYLSYAVEVGKNKKVSWSGIPAEYGGVYTTGSLSFADGTTVQINSGQVGLVSSFTDSAERMYSIIYTPEATEGLITVDHSGDSKFEVITPAVIAGVEGTKFTVRNLVDTAKLLLSSDVNVQEGTVYVEDRSKDATEITVTPKTIQPAVAVNVPAETLNLPPGLAKQVPRKPVPWGWKKK